MEHISPQKIRYFDRRHLNDLRRITGLSQDVIRDIEVVSAVLPFRVNNYVIEELIDWSNLPDDPIYQLTFPQAGMLSANDYHHIAALVERGAGADEIRPLARAVQRRLNPHPAGQVERNVPRMGGRLMHGMQHKYRETLLFFPAQGQTCHSYCTYCFRWAQFVGIEELKIASREVQQLVAYLRAHREVTSVLITGGDPLVMRTTLLRRYLEPLFKEPGLEHIETIRLGTKALSYWPYRFVTDSDADDLLRLFEEVSASGKQLAVMAHYSHARELASEIARAAVERVRSSGATVRSQAPVVRHVNDDARSWSDMWRAQLRLGVVPYYMFVERDTGPRNYFEIPLRRALQIFNDAVRNVSGLGRTVRGPSMSATPGKVLVDGIAEIDGLRVFVLKLLQARDPALAGSTFFAHYDPDATWLDQLQPVYPGDLPFMARGLRPVATDLRAPMIAAPESSN